MRIYQRKRIWYIDSRPFGQRKSLKTTSKKVAQLVLNDMEVKVAKGEFLGIKDLKEMLFDKLCEKYLEYSKANKAPKSYTRDGTSTKNLLNSYRGRSLTQITVYDVELYKSMRMDEVKPATVNRELACIKHMFNKAVQWGYLASNQLHQVKNLKEPPGRTRYLTEDETVRLLEACAPYVRSIVILALNTGMRKSEILKLKWQDVDMQQRIIIVKNSKNNEQRILPINEDLWYTLKSLDVQLDRQYVFAHPNGKPYRDVKDAFSAAKKRADIHDMRFHDLRHTYAVYLARNGTPLTVLQKLLGHKTIAMTMRYAQFSDQRYYREAVDKLKFSAYNRDRFGTNLAQTVVAKK